MTYKYLLPFGTLPFHFVDGFFAVHLPLYKSSGRKFVLEVGACEVEVTLWVYGGDTVSGCRGPRGRWAQTRCQLQS